MNRRSLIMAALAAPFAGLLRRKAAPRTALYSGNWMHPVDIMQDGVLNLEHGVIRYRPANRELPTTYFDRIHFICEEMPELAEALNALQAPRDHPPAPATPGQPHRRETESTPSGR